MLEFSAVCYLYAKYMTDILGANYIFGLIDVSLGGSHIEAWSSKEVLSECHVGTHEPHLKYKHSTLYNAFIQPLFRHQIHSVLWYQGKRLLPAKKFKITVQQQLTMAENPNCLQEKPM